MMGTGGMWLWMGLGLIVLWALVALAIVWVIGPLRTEDPSPPAADSTGEGHRR